MYKDKKIFLDFDGVILDSEQRIIALKNKNFSLNWEDFFADIDWESLLPEVTNAGSEMVTTMAEGVANNTALKDATTKMISEAQTAAKTQANTGGREIGLQMDNGITAGIVAGRSGVVNAMVETVREAIAAAAAEAEIHSPSHVMEDFIGLNLMKGWARGEEKGTDLVIAILLMNTIRGTPYVVA